MINFTKIYDEKLYSRKIYGDKIVANYIPDTNNLYIAYFTSSNGNGKGCNYYIKGNPSSGFTEVSTKAEDSSVYLSSPSQYNAFTNKVKVTTRIATDTGFYVNNLDDAVSFNNDYIGVIGKSYDEYPGVRTKFIHGTNNLIVSPYRVSGEGTNIVYVQLGNDPTDINSYKIINLGTWPHGFSDVFMDDNYMIITDSNDSLRILRRDEIDSMKFGSETKISFSIGSKNISGMSASNMGHRIIVFNGEYYVMYIYSFITFSFSIYKIPVDNNEPLGERVSSVRINELTNYDDSYVYGVNCDIHEIDGYCYIFFYSVEVNNDSYITDHIIRSNDMINWELVSSGNNISKILFNKC